MPAANDSYDPGEEPIPGYRVVSSLGAGAYGHVYKVFEAGSGKHFAIKVIDLTSNPNAWKEIRSFNLIKNLSHTNLMPIFTARLKDKKNRLLQIDKVEEFENNRSGLKELILVMALGEKSLGKRIKEIKRNSEEDAGVPTEELIRYMQGAAKGIDYLNDKNLIHCDIKPDNLMIVSGEVQVADCGVAVLVKKDSEHYKKTRAAGAPAYSPPELISNEPTKGTDQYSLAVTYFELRTGVLPFADDLDLEQLTMTHAMGRLNFDHPLITLNESRVLRWATSLKLKERYDSCYEMVKQLERAVDGIEPSPPKFLSSVIPPKIEPKSRTQKPTESQVDIFLDPIPPSKQTLMRGTLKPPSIFDPEPKEKSRVDPTNPLSKTLESAALHPDIDAIINSGLIGNKNSSNDILANKKETLAAEIKAPAKRETERTSQEETPTFAENEADVEFDEYRGTIQVNKDNVEPVSSNNALLKATPNTPHWKKDTVDPKKETDQHEPSSRQKSKVPLIALSALSAVAAAGVGTGFYYVSKNKGSGESSGLKTLVEPIKGNTSAKDTKDTKELSYFQKQDFYKTLNDSSTQWQVRALKYLEETKESENDTYRDLIDKEKKIRDREEAILVKIKEAKELQSLAKLRGEIEDWPKIVRENRADLNEQNNTEREKAFARVEVDFKIKALSDFNQTKELGNIKALLKYFRDEQKSKFTEELCDSGCASSPGSIAFQNLIALSDENAIRIPGKYQADIERNYSEYFVSAIESALKQEGDSAYKAVDQLKEKASSKYPTVLEKQKSTFELIQLVRSFESSNNEEDLTKVKNLLIEKGTKEDWLSSFALQRYFQQANRYDTPIATQRELLERYKSNASLKAIFEKNLEGVVLKKLSTKDQPDWDEISRQSSDELPAWAELVRAEKELSEKKKTVIKLEKRGELSPAVLQFADYLDALSGCNQAKSDRKSIDTLKNAFQKLPDPLKTSFRRKNLSASIFSLAKSLAETPDHVKENRFAENPYRKQADQAMALFTELKADGSELSPEMNAHFFLASLAKGQAGEEELRKILASMGNELGFNEFPKFGEQNSAALAFFFEIAKNNNKWKWIDRTRAYAIASRYALEEELVVFREIASKPLTEQNNKAKMELHKLYYSILEEKIFKPGIDNSDNNDKDNKNATTLFLRRLENKSELGEYQNLFANVTEDVKNDLMRIDKILTSESAYPEDLHLAASLSAYSSYDSAKYDKKDYAESFDQKRIEKAQKYLAKKPSCLSKTYSHLQVWGLDEIDSKRADFDIEQLKKMKANYQELKSRSRGSYRRSMVEINYGTELIVLNNLSFQGSNKNNILLDSFKEAVSELDSVGIENGAYIEDVAWICKHEPKKNYQLAIDKFSSSPNKIANGKNIIRCAYRAFIFGELSRSEFEKYVEQTKSFLQNNPNQDEARYYYGLSQIALGSTNEEIKATYNKLPGQDLSKQVFIIKKDRLALAYSMKDTSTESINLIPDYMFSKNFIKAYADTTEAAKELYSKAFSTLEASNYKKQNKEIVFTVSFYLEANYIAICISDEVKRFKNDLSKQDKQSRLLLLEQIVEKLGWNMTQSDRKIIDEAIKSLK